MLGAGRYWMNSGAVISQRSIRRVAVGATNMIVLCCGSASKATGRTCLRASLSVKLSRLSRFFTSTISKCSWLALWT